MAYLAATIVITLSIFTCYVGTAEASAFRGNDPMSTLGRMSVEEVRATMLDELMSALGNGNRVTEDRLGKIEEALRPTFNSMTKNKHGNLEHSAVRYVLHRLFVQRHGMYVKGLDSAGEAWTGDLSSPTSVLEDLVPSYVLALFEERLKGRGLGLHETAILAATLEHLIHNEAVERLTASYQAHGLSENDQLPNAKLQEVIDTYMVLFIMGKNVSVLTPEIVKEERDGIEEVYPAWPESQKFSHGVMNEVLTANKGDAAFAQDKITFNATAKIVEEIGERYGRWQDVECHDLKGALMKMEEPGTGRVPLKKFYGDAMDGAWQFTESVDYLRELGALDETDPKRKSVIMSNYINSPSNCLASSGLYSVCCLNECEDLMGHIEKAVGQPDATTAQVFEIVTNLPSNTEQAPRSIAQNLRSLLGEVAEQHDGRVPLHGRLFAQWMHHAYPHECPYPHKAGTTKPMTPDEWLAEKGGEAVAEDHEMLYHVTDPPTTDTTAQDSRTAGASKGSDSAIRPLMWTVDEELVVTTTRPPRRLGGTLWVMIRNVALVLVLFSLGMSLRQVLAIGGGKQQLPFSSKEHHC